MKIIIAGATGFVGLKLSQYFVSQSHEVIALSRSQSGDIDGIRYIQWNGKSLGEWQHSLESADAIINLCGAGVAEQKWTLKRKEVLKSSRIESTQILSEAICSLVNKPKIYIGASAVGYYGDRRSDLINELSHKGVGFLADLCEQWEESSLRLESCKVERALIRIGIVLEKEAGALSKFIPPFKFFAGGPLGPGSQWMPWIHRDDLIGIIDHLVQEQCGGIYNGVAPEQVDMNKFCKTLGSVMKRPSWLSAPSSMLRLIFGEMADLFLQSQRVEPKKILESGYIFKYPTLRDALERILK